MREEAEERVQELIKALDEKREELGWSVYRLAQEAGLNQTTTFNVLAGRNYPTLIVYVQLAQALDLL